jgi:anthranilate phosphoribosyltransferase
MEDSIAASDFGFATVTPEELSGGNSVEDAAKIFRNVLEGKGTPAQKNVVIANAALGIRCISPERPLNNCVAEACESLESGKALNVLTKLINIQ